MGRLLIIVLCFSLYSGSVSAQQGNARQYTEQHPLIFEDSEAIWPYSFINDAGDPDGYCIDLVKIIMRELDIPYEIRLKPHQETLQDLKEGKADLILGLGDVYEEKYGHYSQTTVTLLTQSVAAPKDRPTRVLNFRDLKNQKVSVKDSSLCHHLMEDYGWGANATVCHDPAKELQKINDTGEGQMVWNTMTLKWLINHYKLGNLTLEPVNMPHGQTQFLSNDEKLLELIDNTYNELSSHGKLAQLEEKWLYPNHEAPQKHIGWVWYLAALAIVLLALSVAFLIRELRQNYKSTKKYHLLSHKLAVAAENNKMRFWAYHVFENKYEWFADNGMPIKTYTADEFAQRYSKSDFERLKEAIGRIATRQMDKHGHAENEETLELKAKDKEFGDGALHDFVIHLSVLSRDEQGKPMVIIGAKKDVTKEHYLKQINTERSLRYLSMFYNNDCGILYFDGDGKLEDANPKAGELLQLNVDEAVEHHTYLNSILHTVFTNYKGADLKQGTTTVGDRTVKYAIKTATDELNQLIGIFVFCI